MNWCSERTSPWDCTCTQSRMLMQQSRSQGKSVCSMGSCGGHVRGFHASAAFSGHGKATSSKQGERIIAVSFAGRRTAIFENHR